MANKVLGYATWEEPEVVAFWDPVVEKVSKKLAHWKRSYISIRGRITLIKGVLSNVSVYYMSMYKVLNKVSHAIKEYQRKFLWEAGNQKKDHSVNEGCGEVEGARGFELGRIKERNLAILGKWVWRLLMEQVSL